MAGRRSSHHRRGTGRRADLASQWATGRRRTARQNLRIYGGILQEVVPARCSADFQSAGTAQSANKPLSSPSPGGEGRGEGGLSTPARDVSASRLTAFG